MNNSSIAVFDSGWGGLSILKSLKDLIPNENYIYLGDHKYMPYGLKSTQEIIDRTLKIIKWLLENYEIKLIVIACNTATVAGIENYRKMYPNIPIVGVVPVIKSAANNSIKKKFAVISTVYTANSEYQKKLIDKFSMSCFVYNIGSEKLANFVENGSLDSKYIEMEIKKLLSFDILKEIDFLVLGCTQYPFLKTTFKKIIGPGIDILDSGSAVARQVKRIIEANNIVNTTNNSTFKFYSTKLNKNTQFVFDKLTFRKSIVYEAKI